MPHTFHRRVEFADTDMAGIMHFSNFFRFMEAAEVDFLRSIGLNVGWMAGNVRYGFPRVSASCDFKKPAQFQDLLEIRVSVEQIGEKAVTWRHEFYRDGDLLATGRIVSVCCRTKPDHQLESVEIPAEARAKLESAK